MYLGIWSDIEIVHCTEVVEGDLVTSNYEEDQENGEGRLKSQQTFSLSKGGGTMVMGAPLSKSRRNHRR